MRFAFGAFALVCVVGFAAPASAQRANIGAAIAAMDLNGDGAITRAEAERARAAMFDRGDTNGDGFISRAERDALAASNTSSGRVFDGADTNNDGAISRAELMSRPYRAFDRLDRNNDNVLSAQELQRVIGRS